MACLFKFVKKAACFFLPAALFFSCTGIKKGAFFTFPQLPDCSEKVIFYGWKVQVFDGENLQELEISSDETGIYIPWLEEFSSFPVSIIAYPVTNYNDFFKPCGTIFPGSQNLSWTGGFCAQTAANFYRSCLSSEENSWAVKNFSCRFNWKKMISTVEEKTLNNRNFYNPWLCDSEEILSEIFSGTISASSFNQKNCSSIPFEKLKKILEIPDFQLFSDYSAMEITSFITIKANQTEKFLLFEGENSWILTALLNSEKELSLELNKIPI